MDPAQAVDVVGGAAVSLVFEGLLTFDARGELAPGLSRSWGPIEGGAAWRFEIDPAARTSAGDAIGVRDVIASFTRLVDPKTASPRAWVLERIEGVRAFRAGEADHVSGLREEDGALVIRLESPSSSFLRLLAMPNAVVLPGGSDVSGDVGTGPWVLAERVRDSHLTFRRNPYWHGRAAHFDELHVRILPEEFTRVAEFEVGNLDVLEVPPSQSQRLHEHVPDPGRIVRQIALVTEYVGLDNEDPVLSDVRVRRALNYGVNVAQILATVLEGRGVRSVGAIPPTLPGSGAAQPYEYDPDRARALLREADVPADWTLELWQRPSPLASQVLEAIQADLKRIGVEASIRVRDWGALKASIDRGETQAFFINWYADYPDAENFLVPLFHSKNIGGGGNRARFADATTDSSLDALDAIEDPAARARAASEIDEHVHELAPWIYLWHPILEIAVAPRIEGYRPMPVSFCERWLDVRATPDSP